MHVGVRRVGAVAVLFLNHYPCRLPGASSFRNTLLSGPADRVALCEVRISLVYSHSFTVSSYASSLPSRPHPALKRLGLELSDDIRGFQLPPTYIRSSRCSIDSAPWTKNLRRPWQADGVRQGCSTPAPGQQVYSLFFFSQSRLWTLDCIEILFA